MPTPLKGADLIIRWQPTKVKPGLERALTLSVTVSAVYKRVALREHLPFQA